MGEHRYIRDADEVASVLSCIVHAVEVTDVSGPGRPRALQSEYERQSWLRPLETELHEVNRWSICSFSHRKKSRQRDATSTDDLARLARTTSREALRRQLEEKVAQEREQEALRDQLRMPKVLKINRIEEDPLEARWDAKGNPLPLGRNVLGEWYAPRHDRLRYLHTRSATQIFAVMKPLVKQSFVDRERERIARLNQQKKIEERLALQRLEEKFDSMFQAEHPEDLASLPATRR